MSSSSSNRISAKALLKTRRGQIIFCVAGLLISVIFLLGQFGFSSGSLLPGEADKAKLERELKKLEADQKELEAELTIQQQIRSIAESKFNGAWQSSVHGAPEVELRALVENAAKKLELRLNNISTVRKSSFNKDLALLELDVSLTGDIDTLMKFLLAVRDLKPELYWKRFDCRMSYMFGMPGVNFNGTLRCACDERPIAAPKSPNGGSK